VLQTATRAGLRTPYCTGAHANVVNQYGRTPLHYAAVSETKAVRVCKMLLKAGADTQARTLARHALFSPAT
jgi:ankyrin repeat protein